MGLGLLACVHVFAEWGEIFGLGEWHVWAPFSYCWLFAGGAMAAYFVFLRIRL